MAEGFFDEGKQEAEEQGADESLRLRYAVKAIHEYTNYLMGEVVNEGQMASLSEFQEPVMDELLWGFPDTEAEDVLDIATQYSPNGILGMGEAVAMGFEETVEPFKEDYEIANAYLQIAEEVAKQYADDEPGGDDDG